jgi:RNA polymerase sigma-70 factor (ECF subfamily)
MPNPFISASRSIVSTTRFEQVILPHEASLHGPAYQLTRNASDAEDLVQETLLRAYSRFASYRDDGSPRAWLHTIMRNLFINGWRKRSREPQQVSLDALPDAGASAASPITRSAGSDEISLLSTSARQALASPERVVLSRAESDALLGAVRELPHEFRDVVLLADVRGLSYQEIADRMGVPIGTVRSRLSRGRKRVQRAVYAWQNLAAAPAPTALPA